MKHKVAACSSSGTESDGDFNRHGLQIPNVQPPDAAGRLAHSQSPARAVAIAEGLE